MKAFGPKNIVVRILLLKYGSGRIRLMDQEHGKGVDEQGP